jgi:hypothetical protein
VLTGSRGAQRVFLSCCGGSAREALMRCPFVARFLFAQARRADHVFVFKDGSRGSVSSLALGSDRDVFSSEVFERQNAERRQGYIRALQVGLWPSGVLVERAAGRVH